MRSLLHISSMRGVSRAAEARYAAGFTVIELMIVVAILVILIAIAGPDLRSMIVGARIKNASFDIFSTLTHARSEAVTRNTTVLICRGADWASGWTVTFAADCDSITTQNTLRKKDAYQGITINNSAASVSFSSIGRAIAAASFEITAAGASQENMRCVTIDPSRQPHTKPPVKTGFACP